MAIYHLTLLRSGPVAHPYHITAGLSGITLENGDEVLEIPTEFEGYPVTEIGYYESIDPAHEHFHDWHHPAQGAEWVPDTYQTHSCSIYLDERVKRVILPPTQAPSPREE